MSPVALTRTRTSSGSASQALPDCAVKPVRRTLKSAGLPSTTVSDPATVTFGSPSTRASRRRRRSPGPVGIAVAATDSGADDLRLDRAGAVGGRLHEHRDALQMLRLARAEPHRDMLHLPVIAPGPLDLEIDPERFDRAALRCPVSRSSSDDPETPSFRLTSRGIRSSRSGSCLMGQD